MEDVINDLSVIGGNTKLLSKKEMAAEIGVSYRTIERWFNSGYLNRIRIGGRIFFSYAEIHRLRDQFLGDNPNASRLVAEVPTIDDILLKQQREGHLYRR
jgi:excisionase family DNA binding protein